jgi:transcriptional regulator with XRE-family HTH domain
MSTSSPKSTQLHLSLIMSPDERLFFAALGTRIAAARNAAGMTQVQLADGLAISQPQLASYEVGRRRVPVSMLPRLAKLLGCAVEALIGDDTAGSPDTAHAPPRRTRRGPPSRIEQQLDAIAKLPKARQKMIHDVLSAVLVQAQVEHATG